MNDYIDKGEAGSFDDGQEDLFDLDESEEFDEIDEAYRREQLQWLADRGLCALSDALEYFKGQSAPASEYARITRNYLPIYSEDRLGSARFTVCRADENPILEIWERGCGPNGSEGLAVIQQKDHCLIRHGFPRGYQLHYPGALPAETSVERATIDKLLEPLKTMRLPLLPGEGAIVLDDAVYGFEVLLGSTRFSYQWHTIPPEGWEPVAEWLHKTSSAIQRLLVENERPPQPGWLF